MKAAWANWITGLGDSNADIRQLTDNLVKTVTTAIGNMTPIIGNIIKSFSDCDHRDHKSGSRSFTGIIGHIG